ncbi:MAG: endonuclease/exonuclease/phosphatase family protein [Fulvivirga sp.]
MTRQSFLLLLFFLFIVVIGSTAQDLENFKLLNYNALHGFSGDSLLKERFINWVNKIDPDMVAFQEMNGYSQNEIGELAESYGHPYAVIMNREFGVPVTHPLAITSKFPIVKVERVMDNMWHGYIYARINDLHLFVTHLAPFTLKDRQKDIKKILTHINLLPKGENVLIAGDMNALSPMDSTMYDDYLLKRMKRIEGRLEPKSGTPIVRDRIIYRNNLNNNQIDYSVIQMIIDEGLKDTFYLTNRKFKNSVPSAGFSKKSSIPRRIDYVWVNDELARLLLSAEIIQDEVTAHLSDHYPILVEFK